MLNKNSLENVLCKVIVIRFTSGKKKKGKSSPRTALTTSCVKMVSCLMQQSEKYATLY